MPAGLQVWDTAGNLILDTSDRVGRLIGVASISGSGSLSDARFSQGEPFYLFLPTSYSIFASPLVTFSGTTMSYAQQGSDTFSGLIYYGVS